MFKKVAIFVAAVAVILFIKPELVLKLPMGFIPYAMLGFPPPGYFNFAAWQKGEFETWAKDGDLVVAAGAKSGTNWLLYMSHLIRVKGNVEELPFDDVLSTTPWPTLLHYPGQKWQELKEGMKSESTLTASGQKVKDQWDNPNYPFRIFKSHETPDDTKQEGPHAVLPVRSKRNIKFLASTRNPQDALRSFYPFFANHRDEFRNMWGGFPPVYPNKDALMNDFLDGGVLSNIVWEYPVVWWEYRNDPNVLLFNYDSMLEDTKGHVEKLAKFLEVDLTDAQVELITKMTSFTEMKKVASKFNYFLWGAPEIGNMMRDETLLRAGKKGQGGEFFTEEEKTRITEHINKHFSPELKEFLKL